MNLMILMNNFNEFNDFNDLNDFNYLNKFNDFNDFNELNELNYSRDLNDLIVNHWIDLMVLNCGCSDGVNRLVLHDGRRVEGCLWLFIDSLVIRLLLCRRGMPMNQADDIHNMC